MRFVPTELVDAYLIETEPVWDERGFFERTWCRDEFAANGLDAAWVQSSTSFNPRKGTLRGLHYQAEPFPETKLIRCTRGSAFDVIVDLRPHSSTVNKWASFELTAQAHRALYVPPGFAHGFQTLADDTEINYLISEVYHPELSRGIRWDDSMLAIRWPPCEERLISPRDLTLPGLSG
jgi:dTDP-4-dehydrorhamnose 3,5-epimerase